MLLWHWKSVYYLHDQRSCQVNYRNVSSCEVPPFSICFHYYFHTVGLLWILLRNTVSGKCNKSHVLILSVWFHQASYTPRKKNYEVLFIVSARDNSTDKLKFVWLADTLLLGYISFKWLAWSQQTCLNKNFNIWLLYQNKMENELSFTGITEIWDILWSIHININFLL